MLKAAAALSAELPELPQQAAADSDEPSAAEDQAAPDEPSAEPAGDERPDA
jgi:hypothetical protein